MKKRFSFIDFLIVVFLLNLIISVILFVNERDVEDLIFAILNGLCFVIYVLFLLSSQFSKKYLFVYDDFYLVNGVNIIKESKTKKISKYKKYGLDSLIEERYAFINEKNKITFKLVKIDNDRKVIVIKNKYFEKYISSFYEKDYELMLNYYYSSHEIVPYSSEQIVKNKRNIGIINEINGKFVVSMYRHKVPI